MKKIILAVILVNLLTGCSLFKSKKSAEKPADEPVASAPASGSDSPRVGDAASANVNAQPMTQAESNAAANTASTDNAASAASSSQADPLNDSSSALAKRSVYFPFDVDAIQNADKPTIQAHGEYLGSHPERKVRVEGNADERGSSEYNLALGQRRANNTRKALVLSGAKASQIEAISYGEEKPVATGHDEDSWAQNRRSDIKY
jgi:peptidoglycan-associated lipoprotein